MRKKFFVSDFCLVNLSVFCVCAKLHWSQILGLINIPICLESVWCFDNSMSDCWRQRNADEALFLPLFKFSLHEEMHLITWGKTEATWKKFVDAL